MTISQEVIQDIQEMNKVNVFSNTTAEKMVAYVKANESKILGYQAEGLAVFEITEFVRQAAVYD